MLQAVIEGYLRPMLADNWDRGSLYSYRAFSFPSDMPYEEIRQPVMFITGEKDGALTRGAKKVLHSTADPLCPLHIIFTLWKPQLPFYSVLCMLPVHLVFCSTCSDPETACCAQIEFALAFACLCHPISAEHNCRQSAIYIETRWYCKSRNCKTRSSRRMWVRAYRPIDSCACTHARELLSDCC